MIKAELFERSAVRCIEKATNGGLKAGELGLLTSKKGLGKTSVPTIIVLLGSCLFRILWIYTIFKWIGTIQSLFLLYIFSWAITAIAEMIYFVKIYRKI